LSAALNVPHRETVIALAMIPKPIVSTAVASNA
jgi:hypothetical protein